MEEIEIVQKLSKKASDILYDFTQISSIITSITGKSINPPVEAEGPSQASSSVSFNPPPVEEHLAVKQPQKKVSAVPPSFLHKHEEEETKQVQINLPQEISKSSPEAFLQLVLQRKSIKISEAAKELGVSKEIVEKWASILNEQGLVKLKYPIFGEPTVSV